MRNHKENPDGIFAASLLFVPVCHGRGEKDWQKVHQQLWQRTFYYASKKHEASLPATHSEIKVGRRSRQTHKGREGNLSVRESCDRNSTTAAQKKNTVRGKDRKGL